MDEALKDFLDAQGRVLVLAHELASPSVTKERVTELIDQMRQCATVLLMNAEVLGQ